MTSNTGSSSVDPSAGQGESSGPGAGADRRPTQGDPRTRVEQRVITKPARTSVAAAFALALGVAALVTVLTLVLAPVGALFALLGVALGVVGMKMAKRTGITGKGVAIGGLVLSVTALLLFIAGAIGLTTVLNDERAVERLEERIEQLRDRVPTDVDLPST